LGKKGFGQMEVVVGGEGSGNESGGAIGSEKEWNLRKNWED